MAKRLEQHKREMAERKLIAPKAKGKSKLYENTNYLKQKKVNYEVLPDTQANPEMHVSKQCEVEQQVIDTKAQVLQMRKEQEERAEKAAQIEKERREKERLKKERYLAKHPEMRHKHKDAANSDDEPRPAAMVEPDDEDQPEVNYFKSETPHLVDTPELEQFNPRKH